MRTHYLKDLSLPGSDKILSQEPEFDFHRVKKVDRLSIDFGAGDRQGIVLLTLTAAYRGKGINYRVTILFEDVRELVLPAMNPWFFLSELEIEDVRERMMEGICYEVVSRFDCSFRCYCRDVLIAEFEMA